MPISYLFALKLTYCDFQQINFAIVLKSIYKYFIHSGFNLKLLAKSSQPQIEESIKISIKGGVKKYGISKKN
jgi:hypothetical protein